ncbi:hypothetical protein V5799_020759 [Amblyomma americanum]|uniref:Uncharacterized protein n=1 Tax=Amblyomma americanum TaxID=6943 RepID=A0AAQ4ETD1_AMBAM
MSAVRMMKRRTVFFAFYTKTIEFPVAILAICMVSSDILHRLVSIAERHDTGSKSEKWTCRQIKMWTECG